MLTLPAGATLLVRTDFTADEAWSALQATAGTPPGYVLEDYPDMETPLTVVDDRELDGVDWRVVQAAVPVDDQGAAVLFVADSVTFASDERPLLVVDLSDYHKRARPPFRCLPSWVFEIDGNLSIANMDFEEYAASVDPDGVFRDFRE